MKVIIKIDRFGDVVTYMQIKQVSDGFKLSPDYAYEIMNRFVFYKVLDI